MNTVYFTFSTEHLHKKTFPPGGQTREVISVIFQIVIIFPHMSLQYKLVPAHSDNRDMAYLGWSVGQDQPRGSEINPDWGITGHCSSLEICPLQTFKGKSLGGWLVLTIAQVCYFKSKSSCTIAKTKMGMFYLLFKIQNLSLYFFHDFLVAMFPCRQEIGELLVEHLEDIFLSVAVVTIVWLILRQDKQLWEVRLSVCNSSGWWG